MVAGAEMRVKKEHYVPQFYLENFSSNRNNLYVYDKNNKKSFSAAIRDIANEKYFYDLSSKEEEKLGTKQFIEKFFHPIEGSTSLTIASLLLRLPTQESSCFTRSEMTLLSEYLFYQFIRTKQYRELYINRLMLHMLKKLCDLHLRLKFRENVVSEYNLGVDEPVVQAKFIMNTRRREDTIASFIDRYWIVLENQTGTPFYTSDHPLVKIAHKISPGLTHAGLKSSGIEIVFPISSVYSIVLLEKSYFRVYEEYHCRKVVLNDEENVNFYNWLQIKDSYRQLYCEESTFELINRSLSISPYLFDVDRVREKVEIITLPGGKHLMHSRLLDYNIDSKEVLGKTFFTFRTA